MTGSSTSEVKSSTTARWPIEEGAGINTPSLSASVFTWFDSLMWCAILLMHFRLRLRLSLGYDDCPIPNHALHPLEILDHQLWGLLVLNQLTGTDVAGRAGREAVKTSPVIPTGRIGTVGTTVGHQCPP